MAYALAPAPRPLAPASRPLPGRRRGATITKAIDDLFSDAVRAVQDFSDVAAPIVKSGVDAAAPIVKAGADLEVANHGLEAVEAIKRRLSEGAENYDCVLMDMMMPVMDGAEATREIRRLEKISLGSDRKPHVIVGLSANVGPEYTAKVKLAGMNGSMSKPFYPATLRATLASVKNGTYQGFARLSGEGRERAHNKPGN